MTGSPLTILYDGWPLAYQPNSPAALHLLALLAHHPAEISAGVALPSESFHQLPPEIVICQLPRLPAFSNTPLNRMRWEQRGLSIMADQLGAELVHLTANAAALFGPLRSVISPTHFAIGRESAVWARQHGGLVARLREALAQGGISRARALFWPSNLPLLALESRPAELVLLPPIVHPAFLESPTASVPLPAELANLNLPDTYLLYHGPLTPPFLRLLLEAWKWACGPIGEYYPLLLIGLDETEWIAAAAWLAEDDTGKTIQVLPPLPLPALAALYQRCQALLSLSPVTGWSDPISLAQASAKPVIGLENPLTDALVGPAAYLVSGKESGRALGAALITVTVEESIAASLSEAASQRAAAFNPAGFSQSLAQAYRSLLGNPA